MPEVMYEDFNNVQYNMIHQTIIISTSQLVSDLINAIRSRLELEDVLLSLYQVHLRSIQEMKMDSAHLISKFFDQQP